MSDIVLYKYLFFNHSYFCAIAKFATFENWHNKNIRLQGKFTSCSLIDALKKIANKIRLLAQINTRIGDLLVAETGGDHE
ncbi:MAG: hypothetical protein ACK59J_22190 [Pseudanabaena sp.]|jgi:hypothetical protein